MIGHQRYDTGQFYSNEDMCDEELFGVTGVMESLELDSVLQKEAVEHIHTQLKYSSYLTTTAPLYLLHPYCSWIQES